MNSIISFSRLRPLFAHSLLKRTTNVRPAKSFLSQNVAKKNPLVPCVAPSFESTFVPKRYFNEWTSRTATIGSHNQNHSYVWIMERLTAIASVTSFISMFIHPCENGELFFGFVVATHVHFGLEAIMVDYLRPAVVGNFIPKLIPFFTYALSGSMLALLAWVAIYGNGIAGSLQQLWYLDPLIEPYDPEESKLHSPSE